MVLARKAHPTSTLARGSAYHIMKPIPSHGIDGVVYGHPNDRISLVAIVCQTEGGRVLGRTKRVLSVDHENGGGDMLPQTHFPKGSIPCEIAKALLLSELGAPESVESRILQSCILLGYHKHMVPKIRKKNLVSVGEKEEKLLIFAKICVDKAFKVSGSEISDYRWAESMAEVESNFANMRDEFKYFAEIAAVKVATDWQ